ncbi:hypothetical protein PINS_up011499 [Pythium insidiosum]|nr:hypothetical protein PINS_up011499 [Pythium insidiosum]
MPTKHRGPGRPKVRKRIYCSACRKRFATASSLRRHQSKKLRCDKRSVTERADRRREAQRVASLHYQRRRQLAELVQDVMQRLPLELQRSRIARLLFAADDSLKIKDVAAHAPPDGEALETSIATILRAPEPPGIVFTL